MPGQAFWLGEMRYTVDGLIKLTPTSKEEFDSDAILRCCIERHIAHLGEAVSKLTEELQVAWPEVPWEDMTVMRNILIHQYWAVDRNIVWATLTTSVPELRNQLREIRP